MPELGNLSHSFQAEATLEAYTKIATTIGGLETRGTCMLDVGCWAGCLTTYLASKLPTANFIGLDRAENMINALRTKNFPENVEFVHGDFTDNSLTLPEIGIAFACFGTLDGDNDKLALAMDRLIGENGHAMAVIWNGELQDPEDPDRETPVADFETAMQSRGWQLVDKSVLASTDDCGDHCTFVHYKKTGE